MTKKEAHRITNARHGELYKGAEMVVGTGAGVGSWMYQFHDGYLKHLRIMSPSYPLAHVQWKRDKIQYFNRLLVECE